MPLIWTQLARLRAVALALCLILLSLNSRADASPQEERQAAYESLVAGDYKAAISRLSSLLYPQSRLTQASEIAEAHLLLGVCYFETGNREGAEREFEEAYFLDTGLSLDPKLFSPQAVAFFDAYMANLKQKSDDAASKAEAARREQAFDLAVKDLLVYEKHRYWVNFIPFGAGQFQNGDNGKGLFFLLGETLTLGTSVGLYSYQIFKYGFRGRVPREDIDSVNAIRVAQIGAGGIFWILVTLGVADSLANYEHAVTRQADPKALEKFRGIFESSNSPTSSFQLMPLLTPDAQGASIRWEF